MSDLKDIGSRIVFPRAHVRHVCAHVHDGKVVVQW